MNNRLKNIRHVALDMDGTIYKGGTLFPFTKPFLKSLTDMGIGYTFLTNNPSKNSRDYLAKLHGMGIDADATQLYTSTDCTIEYLKKAYPKAKRVFPLGTPSMAGEFEKAGYQICEDSATDEPDVVVVAFDMTLNFSRPGRAAWWIQHGKPYVATNPDRVCPTDQPTIWVDCASICACIKEAVGRAPDKVLGKPDPAMLRGILERHELRASELAMVGDRTYTDMAMAERAGAFGVLVLTGETTAQEAEKYSPAPNLIVPSLKEFGEELRAAKKETVPA
jgi:NagD protein